MDHLHYARVCIEIKNDAVLPSKIFLSKCSAIEEESFVEVEVELPGKQAGRGHSSTLCHSQSVSRPMGRNLESKGTPVTASMDKLIEIQQTGRGNASDLGQPDAVMRSESKAPNVTVVRFAPEVMAAEAPSSASHCWKMAPCSDISLPIVNCSSKLAPVVAEEVPMDAGSKIAPCSIGNDRVEEVNVPLVNIPMINHCPQGGLGEDGMSPVPRVILDPTPPVLSMNLQLDDRPPANVESIESLASFSSPSPHTVPADKHRKAPGSAYQDRQLSSFAKVLRRGLDAAAEELWGADCEVEAVDTVPSSLPPELESVEDPAVDFSLSPHDAQLGVEIGTALLKVAAAGNAETGSWWLANAGE
ncbi:hypothetical protein Nepgr_029696 [Nepenthes gracilis]|uniref:Uncharacterized protein n=1 Tax=Nepenthes gracilis TaxID=150966 RepID=A0AAD3Y3H3_NEPGR|nr:hypothetical protein Nepgr_029696 [Nepenthes gracilis]